MKEVLDRGDRVRIRVTPGCNQEALCHPIMPIANALTGTVLYFRAGLCKDDHDYVVDTTNGHLGYYRRDELEEEA